MDRTVRLLREAMEIPELSLGMAIKLMEHHIKRKKIAMKSHTKTLIDKHECVKYLVLKEEESPHRVRELRRRERGGSGRRSGQSNGPSN